MSKFNSIMKVLLIAPYVHQVYELKNQPYKQNGDRNREKEKREENIKLGIPPIREDFYASAAVLHLAAMLKANKFEPIILDLNNFAVHSQNEKYFEYCKKIIMDCIKEHEPALVGINCLFSGVFPDVLKIAKLIKSYSPSIKIATGGIHPTSYPKEILSNCNEIDYVAIGEGENSIVALAASIWSKNESMLSKIKSFGYKDKDGVVKINRETDFIQDLDSLELPPYDLIKFKEFETNFSHFYNPKNLKLNYRAQIFASRACPLACNFCDMFLVMGKKHRKRSVKHIVDEIELLHKKHEVNYFSFMDDNLTLNRSHILDLCDEIIRRKLNIMFDTPNGLWINSIREEIIVKMVEAGLVRTTIAIEHGSDYIRNKVIGKHLERKKIIEVANILRKFNVVTVAGFIMGFPEETHETLKDTYDMMDEIKVHKSTINTLIPFPGTKLFNQVIKDKDNLLVDKWNLDELWKTPINFTSSRFIIKPYKMSLDELAEWAEKLDRMGLKYWKYNPNIKSRKRYEFRLNNPDAKRVKHHYVEAN